MGDLQMGAESNEIDVWLRDGGIVVTASERAARFLLESYSRSRRAEGLTAWPAPNISSWSTFVRNEWETRSRDGRLALNLLQEQSLWAEIIARKGHGAGLLDAPRHRLAARAMEAHRLICDYAPQFLDARARIVWQQDAEEFSAWLKEFEAICRGDGAISTARLPLELAEFLEVEEKPRPPILLAGFDRILPAQQNVFAAWTGENVLHQAGPGTAASTIHFYEAADQAEELAACAGWSLRRIAANPQERLLIIAQDVAQRRGEFERAFRNFASTDRKLPGAANLFEFSLGVPLGKLGLARSAIHLIRWLTGPIAEHEMDWLFTSGYATANIDEIRGLTAFMRTIRRTCGQRTQWRLVDFLREKPDAELPPGWLARMTQSHRRLQEVVHRSQSPLEWSEFVPQLLTAAGWPGERPLVSVEFQILERWQLALETCASLGFAGRKMTWSAYCDHLGRVAGETIFAPESEGAPILIAGPSESAGLTADAIWFLGANEDDWPARVATHSFLPSSVQREAGMPHASPQADWELARELTSRLLSSAPEVCFSFARQAGGVDLRHSRLIEQVAGAPRPLPSELRIAPPALPIAAAFPDESRVPFPLENAAGGSNILSSQSQCAFKAFAIARLGAERWDPAEAGLTAAERGQLLHDAMRRIWSGPPDGIRSHAELVAQTDLASFGALHVKHSMSERIPARARESMPPRYLELEGLRLTALITEWLRFERERVAFSVADTELKASATIAGLNLRMRLDRVDRLNDGSLFVIDYKTGIVGTKVWNLPRPENVQVPLYANFAIDGGPRQVGGLAFAKISAREQNFAGRVRDPANLFSDPTGSGVAKSRLTDEDLESWRIAIENLARDFLAGRAVVDPSDYPKTCEDCGLQALCRIQENRPNLKDDDADGDEGSADE
jgi:ATP-dependent helicase/nuclease subunit B